MSTNPKSDWPKCKRAKYNSVIPETMSDNTPLPGVTFLSNLLKGIDSQRQTGHTDDDLPAPFTVPKSYAHVPHQYLAPDGFPKPQYWLHPACRFAVPETVNTAGKGTIKQQALDFYRNQGLEGVPDPLPKNVKMKASDKMRHPTRSTKLRAARETDQSGDSTNRLKAKHNSNLTRFDDPILPIEDLERTMEIIFHCYKVVTHGRGQFVDRNSKKLVLSYEYMDLETMDRETRQEHQADVDTMMMSTKLFRRLRTPNATSLPEDPPRKPSLKRPSYPKMTSNTLNFHVQQPPPKDSSRASSPLTAQDSSRESSPLTSLPPSDAEDDDDCDDNVVEVPTQSIFKPKGGITTNGALIHGRMYCFGQTVGFSSDILISPYMPLTTSSRPLYEKFLANLPGFGHRIGSRFQSFCNEGFRISRQLLNNLGVPSLASTSKFQPSGPLDFASNLAFTLGNFYNKPHTDNDKGKVYCLWYPIDSISGRIVTQLEGFYIEGGWFIFPEYRTAFNLGGKYGVQIAWDGKSTFHHTLPSKEKVLVREDGQKVHYTRLGCSAQITHTIARAAAKIGTKEQWNHKKNCDRKVRDCDDILSLEDRNWKE